MCLAIVAWNASQAQSAHPATNSALASKAKPAREYRVPLLAEGLKLSDFAGMEPRPELKGRLLEITGFIQNTPHDGEPATEETKVWLGYTKSVFYLVSFAATITRTRFADILPAARMCSTTTMSRCCSTRFKTAGRECFSR